MPFGQGMLVAARDIDLVPQVSVPIASPWSKQPGASRPVSSRLTCLPTMSYEHRMPSCVVRAMPANQCAGSTGQPGHSPFVYVVLLAAREERGSSAIPEQQRRGRGRGTGRKLNGQVDRAPRHRRTLATTLPPKRWGNTRRYLDGAEGGEEGTEG